MAAWVLNLDADVELATAGPYAPTLRVRAAMRPHIDRLRASLLAPDDVLIDPADPVASARGLRGRAFCPTPRAIALLCRAGADPEPHPPVGVLRRVNSRAFAGALGPTMPGAAFVTEAALAHAMLATAPPVGEGWRVKHAFGMAGRNQRVTRAREPDAQDREFVEAGLARGGVQIEPNVAIVDEYAIHGVVRENGTNDLGVLVRQRCDARGAWLATERVDGGDEPPGGTRDAIEREASGVATALSAAGYFGPFGVDAFSYRGPAGEVWLQARSEINARYSMGFVVGFGRPP